jgi:hypothetical protein
MAAKTYSTNALAIEFAIDRAVATKALRGVEPDKQSSAGRPEFSISTFAAALEAHRAANSSNNNDGGDDGAGSDIPPLMAARVRITNANARMRERENDIADGKLCKVADIGASFGMVIEVCREHLISLAGRVADDVAPYTAFDRSEVESKIRFQTYAMMTEMVEGFAAIEAQYLARFTASPAVAVPDTDADTSNVAAEVVATDDGDDDEQ